MEIQGSHHVHMCQGSGDTGESDSWYKLDYLAIEADLTCTFQPHTLRNVAWPLYPCATLSPTTAVSLRLDCTCWCVGFSINCHVSQCLEYNLGSCWCPLGVSVKASINHALWGGGFRGNQDEIILHYVSYHMISLWPGNIPSDKQCSAWLGNVLI